MRPVSLYLQECRIVIKGTMPAVSANAAGSSAVSRGGMSAAERKYHGRLEMQ